MIASDRGLVLRTYPLRETSRIVGVLAAQHGRLRLVAHGSRGRGNRFGASFEAGNEIDLVFSQAAGRELGTIREASLRRAWVGGAPRLAAVATGLAVVELLDRVVPEGAVDAALLASAVGALGRIRGSPDRAHALLAFFGFELALLAHLGLRPDLGACAGCGQAPGGGGWLELGAGALRCGRCRAPTGPRVRLAPAVASALATLAAGEQPPAPLEAAERRAIGLAVHRLLATHVDRYRYPRALGLLKKVDSGARGRDAPRSAADGAETA